MDKEKRTEATGVSSSRKDSVYKRRLYKDKSAASRPPDEENRIPTSSLNRIYCKSSTNMDELPDNCVHLMVTSPPYNVGKEYDKDLSLKEYLGFLTKVFKEVYRVLVPGGRACINIANLGRKPYLPLHAYVIQIMEKIGYIMRGEVIWDKQAGWGTGWGSWKSPTNPVLRDQHEYILIYSKGTLSRGRPDHREPTISGEEFVEFTRSIWKFSPESRSTTDHPAPFPVELPYRLIQLYTFQKEVVLDPFMGSGTTGVAALRSERSYIRYEIQPEYVKQAKQRLKAYKKGKP